MTKHLIFTTLIHVLIISISCAQQRPEVVASSELPYIYNTEHPNPRMKFKLLESSYRPNAEITQSFFKEISAFGETRYESLKPLILEQNIPELQDLVRQGKLSYKELTLFYLYRIHHYETNPELSLNAIISLNPDVLNEATEKDRMLKEGRRADGIFGMPVLLKDNIGFEGIPTTAGAYALKDNMASDAYITKRLKEKGAVILGKTNLSEWAYYFCSGCPLGYSAIGGQSLNPYGRMKIETGGSSSGSGIAIAANYAVAAVGTETSGSILSPSSMNSIVGLKPTVGLLSRTGIIPISGTLDTPGPMTRSVTDNAILMDALTGYDPEDPKSFSDSGKLSYYKNLQSSTPEEIRLVAIEDLKSNSGYTQAIEKIMEKGVQINYVKSKSSQLQGFLTLLNLDMRHDLVQYLNQYVSKNIPYRSVQDLVAFNREDLTKRAPYGQTLFDGIISDTTSHSAFLEIKKNLEAQGREYFEYLMEEGNGDIVLSVNNFHAAYAAVAKYPAMTIPMGYNDNGEPHGLTLIARTGEESKLYQAAYFTESTLLARQIPPKYR